MEKVPIISRLLAIDLNSNKPSAEYLSHLSIFIEPFVVPRCVNQMKHNLFNLDAFSFNITTIFSMAEYSPSS
jgi:hypothetical protein